MTIPTTGLNESAPAGSEALNQGDNRIREYKTQNREVLEVNHVYPTSGQDADAGKHKKVSLIEQADLGTGAEGKPILGAQTVSGKAELVFTDEDNNDIPLTSAGAMAFGLAPNRAALMNLIYPVGIVVTLGVSTNPNTLFGVGTWTAISGRVIVGIDGSQTEFDTLNETGGTKTHTLTVDEIPPHTHNYLLSNQANANSASGFLAASSTQAATSSTGGGAAHNNLQPYIVKYVWERTA